MLHESYGENKYYSHLKTYQVGAMQAAANRSLKKHGDRFLKDYGITSMQWNIIGLVHDSGSSGARISDLAVILDTTMAFLTKNINALTNKEILMRVINPLDSRSRIVTVNPSFNVKCDKIEKDLRKRLKQTMYNKLTPEELRHYIYVLAKFAEL